MFLKKKLNRSILKNKYMDKKKFYITTAIAYASKKPHIGNTYEIVLADAIARFKKLQGFDVCFCTGTDEHGQKIEKVAVELKRKPKDHVDLISNEIKNLWHLMDCNFDIFIRTTNENHVKLVKKIFQKLLKNGDIYKSKYEGLYCVACESFLTNSQLIENRCPDCGREVVKTSEEAYFFKVEKYSERLYNYLKENESFIVPNFYVDEIVNNFLKPGLKDFCVSRKNISWGIPIDSDSGFVIYVWLDALINYISAIGFDLDEPSLNFNKLWPVDLQIVGKDILRFHTTIWPIILMALDLPLPKQILTHQWLLFKNNKMSKSTGNVVYADELVELFSSDVIRFYVLNAISLNHDGTISYEDIIDLFNLELANTLGNLVKRTCDMAVKYFDGKIHVFKNKEEFDTELKNSCEETFIKFLNFMENYKINEAIGCVMNLARVCNRFIDQKAPWTLAKKEDCKHQLHQILFNLIEAIRFIATMLTPIMPTACRRILNQIGVSEVDFNSIKEFGVNFKDVEIEKPEVLFHRIDKEKKLNEIKIFMGVERKD